MGHGTTFQIHAWQYISFFHREVEASRFVQFNLSFLKAMRQPFTNHLPERYCSPQTLFLNAKIVYYMHFAGIGGDLQCLCEYFVTSFIKSTPCLFMSWSLGQFFESISFWKHSQPRINIRKQNDITSRSYKIVDNSKMKQGIKNCKRHSLSFKSAIHFHQYKKFHFSKGVRTRMF